MAIANLLRFTTGSILLLFLLVANISAAEPCATVVGRLATVEGQVEVQRTGSPNWQAGVLGGDLCQGDTVRAGARSRATIALINQSVLRVDQNTAMRLDNISGVTEERSVLSLFQGAFQSFSRKPRGFEVNTPYLNGSIEGTEFVFRVKDGQSELTVLEGLVVASNSQGKVSVSGGESAVGEQGKAPYMRTVVRPRDAVQWSLYYPPVMATDAQARAADPEAQASLQNAASLLYVGRVDEAQANIDKALQLDPNAGLAYALRAVINVVQNNNDQALADGNQAVALSPDSSAAKIALSYAQQAAFDIPAARDTLQQAVQQQPDDALALARLAELQLMLGDRKQARETARQAAVLDPKLARTQMTLGFAALTEFRNEEATTAFERAIDLSSAEPMAHLGLGLAKISNGELEAGGRDIEVAVALDSNNALMRAYLGKTYFEEKRTPLDIEQFDIAKQLDPNDPTAYLYSGIAKQTVNRPVEAVQDLERSIELNDNRAVFRGRLLLDRDRAARGASLARVYKDLGFNQSGIVESTKSLSVDPANSSAHRFLSDSHRDTSRRTEISRVSELLQAQMLQDLNVNPVQPSISSTNLNIITSGGPSAAGFNEFTPLFEQNRTQVNVSMLTGANNTKSGEAVVSTVHDNFSVSGGAFGYDTDGFRDNNDTKHEIYGLFGQWAVSPTVNLQAEIGKRNTDYGDISMHFDPDDFDPTFRTSLDVDTGRIGARFSPNSNSTILLSAIYADREGQAHQEEELELFPGFFATAVFDGDLDEEVYQYDAAYIYQAEMFNITTGAAYADSDREDTLHFAIPAFGIFDPPDVDKIDLDDTRVYAYGNVTLFPGVIGTVGASYHDYDQTDKDFDETNAKLGLRVAATDDLEFRLAYFDVVKPALSTNRTLEPTQVAGFNQFFDDANGTKSTRYGLGVDGNVTPALSFGGEVTRREIDGLVSPDVGEAFFEGRDEWLHRAYAYWTPTDELAVDLSLVYDRSENQSFSAVSDVRPTRVSTYSLPVSVRYFHPGGVFAGVTATYVDQEVDAEADYQYQTGDSDFTLVDMVVGYRLPKRQGIVSLGVQNVFDKEFDYLDDSYRTFQDEPSAGPYLPERVIMGRVTLNY